MDNSFSALRHSLKRDLGLVDFNREARDCETALSRRWEGSGEGLVGFLR